MGDKLRNGIGLATHPTGASGTNTLTFAAEKACSIPGKLIIHGTHLAAISAAKAALGRKNDLPPRIYSFRIMAPNA